MWLWKQWTQTVTGVEDKSGQYGVWPAPCVGHACGLPGGGVAETE